MDPMGTRQGIFVEQYVGQNTQDYEWAEYLG